MYRVAQKFQKMGGGVLPGVVGVGEGEDVVDNGDSGSHIVVACRQRRHHMHAVEVGERPQALSLARTNQFSHRGCCGSGGIERHQRFAGLAVLD